MSAPTTTPRPTPPRTGWPSGPRERYLAATPIFDYDHPALQALVDGHRWRELPERVRIGVIYDFVRCRIPFGYSAGDDLPASRVLADGYGQCNTKANLLVALLRAVGIPARLHGAAVEKRSRRGAAPDFYRGAPGSIVHTWVEILLDGRWLGLEGVTVVPALLDGVREGARPSGGAGR